MAFRSCLSSVPVYESIMISRSRLVFSQLSKKRDPAQILVQLALRDAVAGCQSVLDVGSGVSRTLRDMEVPNLTGIEGYEPCVTEARRLQTHDNVVHGDVRKLGDYFGTRQFEACVALDLIEHLSKEDGLKLLEAMERIAGKRVIVFTPSGFLPQGHRDQNDLQVHLSGWEAAEMAKRGYRVTGLLGPKKLRGEYHVLKRRPAVLWGFISLLLHFAWTRNRPESAAAIMCVKTVKTVGSA
jgi:hypothetical protein